MYRWLVRFQNMDRRWIFLGMGLSVLIPLLFPWQSDFSIDRPVQKIYDAVEDLPAGSTVFISADFDPGSRPELEPFYRAVLHQLFRKDVRVVSATLWRTAPPLVYPMLQEVADKHDKVYGEDYCFLGFKDGNELAIKSIAENIPKTFPKDIRQTPLEQVPVARDFKQLKDFDLIILVSAGFPGIKEYVLQVQGKDNLQMVGATTAVSGPDYIPYYKADQLVGLAAGMPGAAQYEKLVFILQPSPPSIQPDRLLGIEALNVLNLGHIFIVVLIILGNLAYFITRPRGGPGA